ncbi:ubiquinone biosynthesis methyltransferase UbiE [Mesorhizobium sp. VK24D]|uniref:Ubiquinone biosynthesis methyltransferase UbiE n=1 Tax=Mesorhizobium album TaxID=3072314 RepID=A0ABU4Y5Q7_9HYPH|nr:ubiquinone biosynthesis methyltransferase UbiE [Mesorhizobium sp. VK24D]MDX8482279.1 ubiquinone biosynthesis methyltransferase UbiE [Mesorhizobium sp. VK24D]
MGTVHHDLVGEPTFEPMIQIDMEIKNFVSNWRHCDHVSTYMARMISQNRSDSVRYSNLFSSAFNELLEVAFRTRHAEGEMACRVSRHGATDRIELTFPCVPEERQFYQEAVSQLAGPEARERYVSSVSGDLAPSREVVLLELAVDYNATLRVEDAGGDAIKLVVDLPLEGPQH